MRNHVTGGSPGHRSSRRARLLLVVGFTSVALLIATGSGGAESAVAGGVIPAPPPYVCDAAHDGQVVWSDGYLWECKNVAGFFRWVPVRRGHNPYIEGPPVRIAPAGTYRWYVDVPQDPAGTNTLNMSWGDGTPSEDQFVPGGTGSVRLAFDHYYSRILPWELKATLVEWGTHDGAFFWDP